MPNKQELELQEKELVWAFFKNRTAGFFVEVGANDPVAGSQTWHLEQRGWRGILVEPQPSCAELLRQQRKNSLVIQAACSAPEKAGEAMFHFSNFSGLCGLEKHVDDPNVVYERSELVKVTTLDAILESAGNPAIDCVFIDVEGTELDVLRGFDLKKHHPTLILIEDKVHNLAKHFYLRRQGYKLVKRTGVNNWYVPKETVFDMVSFDERYHLVRKMYLATPWRVLKLKLKQQRTRQTQVS
ncbi:MAG: FkbM family methyltransferase [Verrucomicrobia bacterium]|nr:FkbM family methyltransferase [Verrucomicrobiota bacterium]